MELDELVTKAKTGDSGAMAHVVHAMKPLVYSIIRSWATSPGDQDMFLSVLNSALFDAILRFDPALGRFAPYAKTCLNRAVFVHFTKQARYERGDGACTEACHKAAQNTGLAEFSRLVDTLGSDQQIEGYIVKVFDRLTVPQFRAFQAIVRGESLQEAGKRHHVSPQAVGKGMASLRKLMKEVVAEE